MQRDRDHPASLSSIPTSSSLTCVPSALRVQITRARLLLNSHGDKNFASRSTLNSSLYRHDPHQANGIFIGPPRNSHDHAGIETPPPLFCTLPTALAPGYVHTNTSSPSMASHEPAVLAYPHKTDIYTYRVPTPPRIVVPPPTLNADAVPEITLRAIKSSTYNFLQSVNYDNLVQSNAPLEWTYELRREAQTILPFLCLGPMTAAKDEKWLREQGVTMLLGVRQKQGFESRLMQTPFRMAEKLGIEAQSVDLTGHQDLIRSFARTSQMINEHLSRMYQSTNGQQLGKVLVFCESGNERSAGVVAAYLMEMHEDVDYIKAMQLCQAQRFCVNFDDSMKRLLQGYWDILCAQRTVQAQQQVHENGTGHGTNGVNRFTNGASAPRTKRVLERSQDDDVNMDDDDDLERFGGRTFAPFIDQSQ